MLSHNLKLNSNMAKSPKIMSDKTLVCGLLAFIFLLAIFPIAMLSMVTLQPEMMDIPYLFSRVNSRLKQSGLAEEEGKCTEQCEHELFDSWHTLAHMEDKLLQKVNSTRRDHQDVHEEEDHPDNHPGLLSVDAVGHAILSTTLTDFRGDFNHQSPMQHQVEGASRPPSTSLGKSPGSTSNVAASSNQNAKEVASDTATSDVAKLRATQHIDYLSHPTLRWTPHVKRQSGAFMKKRSEIPTKVTGKDLHGARWEGRIPKVACILAIPASTRAYARLKYVVNNFHSQNYEGPKQLIIVYHYQDHRAAERVRKLADGYLVKAIAARTMEVPSATALRYGAWSADKDTDIVARWDIDGWHHPQRLAMQVRALAFSEKPACLLKRWTVTPGDGSRSVVEGEIGGEISLIGEKAWMDKNWQPFLPEGEQSLLVHQGQMALLDMPEMLVVSPEHHEVSRNSTVSDEASSK
jgi:hypothetical protein